MAAKLFPAMKFDDAPEALDWLKSAFGFEPHVVHKDESGGIAHAEMKLGDGLIMLGGKRPPEATNPWCTEPMGVYVCVEDIETHYAKAKAAGAEIVRPLSDTPYGAREYSARDCGGHLWSFGTYDPWKA
ncbi:VOC family protein [Dongia sp.]|uniref:VOC family protein n=1 Tax=Dongia sp. TaxID=1977262 RepID=UPI0035B22604